MHQQPPLRAASAVTMESTALPICFPVPDNPQAPPPGPSRERHQLHGADDLLTLFKLKPLWERSVKSYIGPPKSKLREQAVEAATREREKSGASRKDEEGNGIGKTDEADTSLSGGNNAETDKPLVMEKTYVNYVKDLPGQVKPPRRTVNKYNAALAAASSSGSAMPTLPVELTGQTTMREIVFRPETTMQRIAPFDDEALRTAFTVEAGPVSDIDLSLLESDDVERQSPHKKKKKRKHQRDNTGDRTDEIAAKRSKLNSIVRK